MSYYEIEPPPEDLAAVAAAHELPAAVPIASADELPTVPDWIIAALRADDAPPRPTDLPLGF